MKVLKVGLALALSCVASGMARAEISGPALSACRAVAQRHLRHFSGHQRHGLGRSRAGWAGRRISPAAAKNIKVEIVYGRSPEQGPMSAPPSRRKVARRRRRRCHRRRGRIRPFGLNHSIRLLRDTKDDVSWRRQPQAPTLPARPCSPETPFNGFKRPSGRPATPRRRR